VFVQLTADEGDLPIPGEPFGFGTLQRAQAAGDYAVLERRERRVVRVHLGADVERSLDRLVAAFTSCACRLFARHSPHARSPTSCRFARHDSTPSLSRPR